MEDSLGVLHRSPVLCCCSLLIAQAPPSFRVMRKVNNHRRDYCTSLDSRLEHTLGNLTGAHNFSSVTGLILQVWPWPGGHSVCAVRTPSCAYECFAPLLGAWWGLYGNLTEDSSLIVRIWLLQTTVCVKSLVISWISHPVSKGFDNRVCPTIGAIDLLISQIPTLLHYSLICVGHNRIGALEVNQKISSIRRKNMLSGFLF